MMQGDALLLILVMVFGCAAFFFGVIYLIGRALAWCGRGFVGVFRSAPSGKQAGSDLGPGRQLVCPREECRREEDRPDARYCSQCGAPLRPLHGLDQYDDERIESLST